VCDVYVDKQFKCWIVDFNPFVPVTDSLLFSWDELNSSTFSPIEFRLIDSPIAMQPKHTLVYRLPKDIIDLSS
jgi:hypothetical protein